MRLTWHHASDGATMQLVPRFMHGGSNGVGHAGGASMAADPAY